MKVNIGKYKKDGTRRTKVEISKDDILSLDQTLAIVIGYSLKEFKAHNHSYPAILTMGKWDEILDKMIFSFQNKAKGSQENSIEMQQGFNLFAKWFQHLWI